MLALSVKRLSSEQVPVASKSQTFERLDAECKKSLRVSAFGMLCGQPVANIRD